MAEADLEALGLGSDSEEDNEDAAIEHNVSEQVQETEGPVEYTQAHDTREHEEEEAPAGLSLRVPSMRAVAEGAVAKLMRTSNVVGVQPTEFHPELFVPEDGFGARAIIRWRTNPSTGQVESNARVVRWSDGSAHLKVGNETLQMDERDARDEHVHLALKHPPAPGERTSLLQGQGRIHSRLNFAPASLNSRLHRRLTSAVGKKHEKREHVRTAAVTVDPEVVQHQQAAAEAEQIKAKRKRREEMQRAAIAAQPSDGHLAVDDIEEGAELEEDEDDGHGYQHGLQRAHANPNPQKGQPRGEFDESRLEDVKKRGRGLTAQTNPTIEDAHARKLRVLDDEEEGDEDDDHGDDEADRDNEGDDEDEEDDGNE